MSTEATDWKKSTVAELRDACTERDLATTGKKQELIDRLEENDAEQGESSVKEEAEETPENGTKEEEEEESSAEVKKEEMEVDEEKEKKPEPIMLLKGKFHFYYNVNHALKMVIINPIPEDNIQSPEFVNWLKQAKTFEIAKLPDGKCEAVLYFDTLAKGDAAFADLKGTMENEEVKVIHPATADTEHPSNSVSISAGQYWDRIKEYSQVAKPPVTLEESKTESLFNRHVVLENVPESVTEDDLVKKFPEASSVHVYPYSEACRGIRMLEFSQESKVTSFLKENKTVEMDDTEIKLEKYANRVAKWEKEKPKNEPYKPCTLEDERRVELCQELKDLEKAKNSIVNRDDLFGDEKILEHVTIHEKIRPLVEQLKMDTNRRKEEKLKFPEPDELKNNYTKFAEAPDFARRKKQSVFGRKQQEQGSYDRKRSGDSWGYEPAYKRQNMVGGGGYGRQGGYGGGGYGGGGGGGLMNMVQGLQNALSSMGGQRRGGGGGGYGGGYGSGYGGGYGRGGMRGGGNRY